MDIKLSMHIPRDASTLPLVRHLTKHALREIGASRACIGDVEVAVTEACANVVEHTTDEDDYSVDVELTDTRCEIRVIDSGHGFDFETLGRRDAETTAEGGRGIQLMRALVDTIKFTSEPESGTVVHLVKDLEFDGAPDFIRRDRDDQVT
ncbi:MAG: serine/threonine-protein kinase RsbW [Actinomycetota bacterium]